MLLFKQFSRILIVWAYFLIFFFCQNSVKAQTNLVLNPSFEIYDTCPFNTGQIKFCKNWFQPTRGTPDYLNECSSIINPITTDGGNLFGYQVPRTGKAMGGITVYQPNPNPSQTYREYLMGLLAKPLIKGRIYKVSFYVNLSKITTGGSYNDAIANLGMYLSSTTYSSSSDAPIPFKPQIQNPDSNIIDDTLNWTLISGNYKSLGNEKFIFIGNFSSDSETIVKTYKTNPRNSEGSYYYIDDVAVIDTASYMQIYYDTVYICDGSKKAIHGRDIDSTWTWFNSTTSDSVIVDKPGKYWKTFIQGGDTTIDSIDVIAHSILLNIETKINLCLGKTETIKLMQAGVTYIWNGTLKSDSFKITSPGIYFVVASDFACIASETFTVKYDSNIFLKLPPDTTLCDGQTLILDLSYLNHATTWQDSSTNKKYIVSYSGKYWVMAKNGCDAFSDTINVKYEDCSCHTYVPNTFTPNNNNLNDTFITKGNCDPVEIAMSIYNRWGECIFKSNDLNVGWTGQFRDVPCPEGVYLYQINLKYIDGTSELKKGKVMLIRNSQF